MAHETAPETEGSLRLSPSGMSPNGTITDQQIFRQAVDDSYSLVVITDATGVVEYVNSQFCWVTGYMPEDVLGRRIHEFGDLPAEQRDDLWTTVSSGRQWRGEFLAKKKDGEEYWVLACISPMKSAEGVVTHFLSVNMDITERKQGEEALRQSEERYRALYQDNPTMYFTVDAKGIVLSVNQFGAQQLGYSVEELTGRPVLDVFYPEDKKAVARQLQTCLKSGGEVAHWEFRKVRKDGQVIWVKEAARTTKDIDGNTIVLVVCEDITEHKLMEEALQRAREELESKVERQIQVGNSYGLTFRELTVLHLVAGGKADKEIGTTLGISALTVNKHVANIRRKMGASSRTEAGVRALKEGVVN